MAIEIVDLPSYKMVSFHSYVSLPEGKGFSERRGISSVVELSPSAETVGINSSAGLAHDDYGTPGSMGNMTWHDIAIVGCIAHLKEQNNLYC